MGERSREGFSPMKNKQVRGKSLKGTFSNRKNGRGYTNQSGRIMKAEGTSTQGDEKTYSSPGRRERNGY